MIDVPPDPVAVIRELQNHRGQLANVLGDLCTGTGTVELEHAERRLVARTPFRHAVWIPYFGYFDPAHIGLVFSAPAAVTDGHDRPVDPAGVYAISVNFLYGFPSFLSDGQGGKTW
ncbi:MAG: hypothetical protein ACC645_26290 [Pirellulales bacterium]